MKDKAQKKTRSILLSGITLGVLVLASFVSFSSSQASLFKSDKNPSGVMASLSGFTPGDKVTYKVTDSSVSGLVASSIIDENGVLGIPIPETMAADSPILKYEFIIGDPADSISLTLDLNTQTGAMNIKGQGPHPFSDVQITASEAQKTTKSDWAGLFQEKGLKAPDQGGAFEVAFYSRDIAQDARATLSPSIIKVFTATGGGGPTNSGVNQWRETNCFPYPLSTCNFVAVNFQNQSIVNNYVHALQLMAQQLTAVGVQHLQIIGTFFDAKEQLETQRQMETMRAQAVKDYHPSEQMCRFGSYMRSLADVEESVRQNQMVLNDMLIETQTNKVNMASATGDASDFEQRFNQYKTTYCNPADNNEGLDILCDHDGTAGGPVGAQNRTRVNKDVDFTHTIEFPYTLDVAYYDGQISDDETDVMALARNLYWPDAWSFASNEQVDDNDKYYGRARSLMALNNLAHNSFTKLVGMKALAPERLAPQMPGWTFMKSMMRDIMWGTNPTKIDQDIENLLGERPSYYAQMDFLTKKIYQNPDFYTNLYDKPVNVDRINAALEAIQLMQMRDHYEASLRREMLVSGMIEEQLMKDAELLQGELLDQ